MAEIAEQMLTEALAAQKFTRKFFVVELDFSEKSLIELEKQFEAAKYALRGGLTPENIDKLTGMWGAYLGEVLRRQTSGAWEAASEGASGPALIRGAATVVSPFALVRTRLESSASGSNSSGSIVAIYDAAKQQLG